MRRLSSLSQQVYTYVVQTKARSTPAETVFRPWCHAKPGYRYHLDLQRRHFPACSACMCGWACSTPVKVATRALMGPWPYSHRKGWDMFARIASSPCVCRIARERERGMCDQQIGSPPGMRQQMVKCLLAFLRGDVGGAGLLTLQDMLSTQTNQFVARNSSK